MNGNWKTKELGKVATLQRGFDLAHRFRKPGTVPIVTSSGLGETHSEAKVSGPGVVTGRYGTIGDVFYILGDFWPLNTTLYVRDFHGNNPLYVSYLLRTIDFHSHSGKSGVPGVNRNDLHEIPVSLPPTLIEQEAIAGALSDADALIETLERFIAKKRAIKQGAMQELLTGKRRLPGFTGKWETKTLREVCHFENGDRGHNYPSASDFLQTGVPFVNAGHVGEGQISTEKMDYISPAKFDTLGGGKFRPSDILFCLRGSLGKFGIVPTDMPTGAVASSLIILRPKQTISHKFLVAYLKSNLCIQMIELWAGGAAQPNLGGQDLARFQILLPPTIAEQSEIGEALQDMDAEIAALDAKHAKARAIKQGMMHNLLTGKIRLI